MAIHFTYIDGVVMSYPGLYWADHHYYHQDLAALVHCLHHQCLVHQLDQPCCHHQLQGDHPLAACQAAHLADWLALELDKCCHFPYLDHHDVLSHLKFLREFMIIVPMMYN